MQEVWKLFRKHYGYSPFHVVASPGRLEWLGDHTDYNRGLEGNVVESRLNIQQFHQTSQR